MASSEVKAPVSIDAIESMWWQTLAPVLLDALVPSSHASVLAVSVGRIGDPEATRTVYTTIVVLAVLGLVLTALAFWVFRRTRPEPELLAPLETMQTRGWRKLDPAAQRRSLDEARPTGAAPLRREASEPAVDSSFAKVAPVASFDDLSDRGADEAVGAEGKTDAASSTVPDETVEDERSSVSPITPDGAEDQPDPEAQSDDTGEIQGDGALSIDIDSQTETRPVAVVAESPDVEVDAVLDEPDIDAHADIVDIVDIEEEADVDGTVDVADVAVVADGDGLADADLHPPVDDGPVDADLEAPVGRPIDPLLGPKPASPGPSA